MNKLTGIICITTDISMHKIYKEGSSKEGCLRRHTTSHLAIERGITVEFKPFHFGGINSSHWLKNRGQQERKNRDHFHTLKRSNIEGGTKSGIKSVKVPMAFMKSCTESSGEKITSHVRTNLKTIGMNVLSDMMDIVGLNTTRFLARMLIDTGSDALPAPIDSGKHTGGMHNRRGGGHDGERAQQHVEVASEDVLRLWGQGRRAHARGRAPERRARLRRSMGSAVSQPASQPVEHPRAPSTHGSTTSIPAAAVSVNQARTASVGRIKVTVQTAPPYIAENKFNRKHIMNTSRATHLHGDDDGISVINTKRHRLIIYQSELMMRAVLLVDSGYLWSGFNGSE
ncbi:hypothetical protein BDN70DRAFT_893716 [Pholiota conissans]|uniref:Uncharacterized protein n=1 Tax=Pholiota conissans TaxID=109636 RepID=A0A9P5Z4M3_9AGAR|nr:hypothetical protein BDN70DRAFT_893716 [Pholiota conissans]